MGVGVGVGVVKATQFKGGRWARPIAVAVAAIALGCGSPIELETDSASTGTTDGSTGTSTSTTTGIEPDSSSGTDAPERAVDIMLVVDNSASMGEEQAKIAIGIGNLVAVLDGADPPIDYRIAVTTTDNGNPWCQGAEAEGGAFVNTSCRERPQDFIIDSIETIDMFDEACGNLCSIDALGLPDPWVEVSGSDGTSNVPGGAIIDALRCMLPQGITGCGYEQPLESMYKAIQRSVIEGEVQNGFLRDGALLAVAVITDEFDCSYNTDHESIFLEEGNQVFWAPGSSVPTSAICWNAGVACTGSGNPYDECHAQDYDVEGLESFNVDQTVLHPISRYIDLLTERDAYMTVIYGIEVDGSLQYVEDPAYETDFGIAPGCISDVAQAAPPVRLREVVQAVTFGGAEYSICNNGFELFMNAFGEGIVQRLP